MNCAEDLFNICMYYNSRCHSKWVCFQTPNTHTSGHFYIGVAPPFFFLLEPQIICNTDTQSLTQILRRILNEKNKYF